MGIKRIYVVFLFLLITIIPLFGGCGKKEKAITQDENYQGEVYPENGLPKEKKVELKLIYPVQGMGKDYFEYAVETFEKKFPNVKLNVRYIEGGGTAYNTIIRSILQSGSDKDMYDWFASYPNAVPDRLEPQDELWERFLYDSPNLKVKDVIIAEKYELMEDGHIYRFPQYLGIVGLYYNRALFKKFGLNGRPKNWEEFLDLSEKIKLQGIFPMVMAGKFPGYFDYGWQAIPHSVGGKEYRDAEHNYEPNLYISKPYITKLERLAEFVRRGYMHPGTISFDHTQSQMEFIQGKAATITCGAWIANEMRDVVPSDFEWGFMPFPGNDPGQDQVVIVAQSGFGYIWKERPILNKQWSKEFNLWLLNIDVQQRQAESGAASIRRDFKDKAEITKNISPSVRVAMEVIAEENIRTVNPNVKVRKINNAEMAKMAKVKGDRYIEIVNGKISALKAAEEINAQYMKGLVAEKKK